MRYEWYVCKYKNGELIGKSPHAMTREEAVNLCEMSKLIHKNFTFKAKHREDLDDVGE